MTSRHHFAAELRWRATCEQEAGQSQTEVVRWLNVIPSMIHILWIFKPQIRHLESSAKNGELLK